MTKRTMKIKGGQDDKATKLEVIQDNPVIAQVLVDFAAQQKGSGKMKGSGSWWSSFVDFLKKNKVISTGTKIGSYIATAFGNLPLATALTAASTVSGAVGYGHMNGSGYVNRLSQVGTGIVFNRSGLIQNQRTTRIKGGAMKNSSAVPTSTTYNAVYSQASGKLRM